jgi:hypothetical protein
LVAARRYTRTDSGMNTSRIPMQPVRVANYVEARHLGVAGVGAQQRGEDAHGGGLAGTVGSQQPEHSARRHS